MGQLAHRTHIGEVGVPVHTVPLVLGCIAHICVIDIRYWKLDSPVDAKSCRGDIACAARSLMCGPRTGPGPPVGVAGLNAVGWLFSACVSYSVAHLLGQNESEMLDCFRVRRGAWLRAVKILSVGRTERSFCYQMGEAGGRRRQDSSPAQRSCSERRVYMVTSQMVQRVHTVPYYSSSKSVVVKCSVVQCTRVGSTRKGTSA